MPTFNPTDEVNPFPPRGEVEPGFVRLEPLMTAEILKSDYLFGIPLESTLTGETMSDETLNRFVVRAVSQIEHEAKIQISPVKFTDKFDYNIWDYTRFNWIQLDHWPVLQIESFKAKYPHQSDFIQYPEEWISVYNEFGVFQLTPTNGSISQFLITHDASLLPLVLGGRARWPQLWQVVYVAGFKNDEIPAIINELVGMYAAISVLEQFDINLFLGGYSLGLDGASQSVSLPGPGWLQTRISSLKERAAKHLDTIKRFYHHQLYVSSI
jgi:hypothetical protein